MLRRSVHLAITLSVFTLGLATTVGSVFADGSFSFSQPVPSNGATGVPVNLPNGFFNQSVALITGGLANACQPVKSSFTNQTVLLTSPTDTQQYMVAAPASGNSGAGRWLAVSSPVAGFELLPYTTYTLSLKGGADGVAFSCGSEHYYLGAGVTPVTTFTTGADTVAPQIMGPQAKATSRSAVVSWETFQPATGLVGYGLNNYSSTASHTGSDTMHRVILNNLLPGTTYTYQIRSADGAGNIGTSNGQFTTLKMGEIVVRDITDMAATVTWTTNRPTDSLVELGADTGYGSRQGNAAQTTNHVIRLTGLTPGTTYHFRVLATNDAGQSIFDDNLFTTKDMPAVAAATTGEDSEENIMLFPQVPFVEPLVLGASDAAAMAGSGVTIGRNLLAKAVPAAAGWPDWLIFMSWLIPLILLITIVWALWRWRHNERQWRLTDRLTSIMGRAKLS